MATAESLVEGIETLASLPDVYQRIKVIVDDPDSSIADLTWIVSDDPGIAARVLKVVNSVYFGLMSRVETISHAINLLGMQQLHDIVLASSVTTAFSGIKPSQMDMRHFWSASVMRGLLARTAAESCGNRHVERIFLEGLLADLGHLVMYQKVPEIAAKALAASLESGRPLHELEHEALGCDYAGIGAALISRWKLPARFATAIADQIDPSLAADENAVEASLLNLARGIQDGMEKHLDDEGIAATIEPFVWQKTGLKPANIQAIRNIAQANHAEVIALFFPAEVTHQEAV